MQYEIKLADGRKLTGLTKNGDNFISKTQVDESMFEDNLATMTVSDGEIEEVYHNVELIQQVEEDDGWHLAFRELSPQERFNKLVMENSDSITDVEVALAEVYEMLIGGE